MIGTRDLKTLYHAQEIMGRLFAEGKTSLQGLESAINFARASLEAQLGRRRQLLEMPPDSVA